MEGLTPKDAAYNTARAEAENQDPVVEMTFASDRTISAEAPQDQSLEMTFATDREQRTSEERAQLAQELGTMDAPSAPETDEELELKWEPEIIEGYKKDHEESNELAA